MRSLPDLLCPVRRILRSRHALAAGLLTCAIGLPLLACSKHPTRPIVRADSPTAVVQRFRTAWIERDTLAFRSCLAETFFGYGSACIDSTGHLFLQIGPGRDSCSWRAWQSMRERVTRSSSAPPQRATDSAGCDSLLRTTWGYALRRYLD